MQALSVQRSNKTSNRTFQTLAIHNCGKALLKLVVLNPSDSFSIVEQHHNPCHEFGTNDRDMDVGEVSHQVGVRNSSKFLIERTQTNLNNEIRGFSLSESWCPIDEYSIMATYGGASTVISEINENSSRPRHIPYSSNWSIFNSPVFSESEDNVDTEFTTSSSSNITSNYQGIYS